MGRTTAYLISCSDHYNHRFLITSEQLKKLGYHTVYITSDFDHTSKAPFVCQIPGCVQLHALPYKKNLSVERIMSHFCFARGLFQYLENLPEEPGVIIALLPPNFLAHFLVKYKAHHPSVKVIFDIFDLWPETFPSSKWKKLLTPAFRVWAWLRDKSIPKADSIITECEFFRRCLGLGKDKSSTIYLSQDPLDMCPEVCLRNDKLDLCYLGAINNVIGISEVCDLLQKLTKVKPVTVHVIGAGERQEEFVESIKAAGAQAVNYGVVYDQNIKQEIINCCHFGLNMINTSACIGLTMKSVDYLRNGLPIISNVPGDTSELIAAYQAGIQFGEDCVDKIVGMTVSDNLQMRNNAARLFEEKFSNTVVREKYRRLFDALL